ncbi:hypothetical protein HK104_003678 [Borealophlyctis nickersoniae]|nr:hypothetical protein HK104_003678 [Borealophlyctis nickersoniae]
MMVASSKQELVFNANMTSNGKAIEANNTLVQSAAHYLLDRFGTYDIPQNVSTTIQTGLGPTIMLARTVDLPGGLRWILMLTIPEDDLLGAIKESRKKIIGTSAGVVVGTLIAAAGVTYIITYPLRTLSRIMKEATTFDFSALKNGYLDARSFIGELSSMQETFNEMIVNFADAIEKSKFVNRNSRQPGSGAGAK